MQIARYRIIAAGDEWTVDADGDRKGSYATKEAALEAAVSAASNAIKLGHGVEISVPGATGEPSIG
jgi:hypothetical protein